jgi:hypothetical protein
MNVSSPVDFKSCCTSIETSECVTVLRGYLQFSDLQGYSALKLISLQAFTCHDSKRVTPF